MSLISPTNSKVRTKIFPAGSLLSNTKVTVSSDEDMSILFTGMLYPWLLTTCALLISISNEFKTILSVDSITYINKRENRLNINILIKANRILLVLWIKIYER